MPEGHDRVHLNCLVSGLLMVQNLTAAGSTGFSLADLEVSLEMIRHQVQALGPASDGHAPGLHPVCLSRAPSSANKGDRSCWVCRQVAMSACDRLLVDPVPHKGSSFSPRALPQ